MTIPATALDALDVPDLTGRALTVAGPVDPAALGSTLMHEHVFADMSRPAHNPRPGRGTPRSREPLTLANLAAVRRGRIIEDNDVLGDPEEMLAEVAEFAQRGGGTIVELSNIGLGRDARALRLLSAASGLHIVMGAGWYERNFHPANMGELTVEGMTETIVRDIVVGVDGSGIRSGIIGEVGVEGNPLSDDERKSVRASARAARITGAPISFHHGGFGEEKLRVLDLVEEEGVDPRRVVMGHTGGIAADMPFARRLLARGVFVEADFLGAPGSPWGTLWPSTDRDVAEGMARLVGEGYADRIVLGQDVCQRLQLKRHGGHGYSYVIEHFLPALRGLGVSEEDIDKMTVANPARALAFAAPVP